MVEILMSIQPKWCKKILDLEKKWELRTTKPKWAPPFLVYIYQTENGGVIGAFICDEIDYEFADNLTEEWLRDTCVSLEEAEKYADGRILYKWRIRSLIEYSAPRPLEIYGLKQPPQGWCYVETQWKHIEGVHMESGQVVIEQEG